MEISFFFLRDDRDGKIIHQLVNYTRLWCTSDAHLSTYLFNVIDPITSGVFHSIDEKKNLVSAYFGLQLTRQKEKFS